MNETVDEMEQPSESIGGALEDQAGDQNHSGEGAPDRKYNASPGKKPILTRKLMIWAFAIVSPITLLILTWAIVKFLTKPAINEVRVIILTVPSGADIQLDSRQYGTSPQTIDRVRSGTHTITISKDGFENIEEQVEITDTVQLDFKLKPLAPSEVIGLPSEVQIEQFQNRAGEAFSRGDYAVPYSGSALNYSDLILSLQESNQFAITMRERVRKALHQSATISILRGDFGQAQEAYSSLRDYYPRDETARIAADKLENQLQARKDEVRGLVRKAEDALETGRLIEPERECAYYYSKQALAIDRLNTQALAIRGRVKERFVNSIEQSLENGDISTGLKLLTQGTHLFPEDRQLRARLQELEATRNPKSENPIVRLNQGLEKYKRQYYAEAAADLEYAVENGQGGPDALFALGRSYFKLGQYDRATAYLYRVPQSLGDSYCSALVMLGDAEGERDNPRTALEHYRAALSLGGSSLYPATAVEDRIKKSEKRMTEKAFEPPPVTIPVSHIHNNPPGLCNGSLSVSGSMIRFDGREHTFSSRLAGTVVRVSRDELTVLFVDKPQKFKASQSDADRFEDAVLRFQSIPGNPK